MVIEDDDYEENEENVNINESPKLENTQNLEGLQNNNNFDDIFNAYRKPVKKKYEYIDYLILNVDSIFKKLLKNSKK